MNNRVVYGFASDPRKEYHGKNHDYGFSGEISFFPPKDNAKYKYYLNCVADGCGSHPNSGRDAFESVNFIVDKLSHIDVALFYDDNGLITEASVKKLLNSWKEDLISLITGGGTTLCGQLLIVEEIDEDEKWTLICINIGDSYLSEIKINQTEDFYNPSYVLLDNEGKNNSAGGPSQCIERKGVKYNFDVKVEKLEENEKRVFLAFSDGVFSSEEKKSIDKQTPAAKQYIANYPIRLARIYSCCDFFDFPMQIIKESYEYIAGQNSDQKFDNATVAVMGFNISTNKKQKDTSISEKSAFVPDNIKSMHSPEKRYRYIIALLIGAALIILLTLIICLFSLKPNKQIEEKTSVNNVETISNINSVVTQSTTNTSLDVSNSYSLEEIKQANEETSEIPLKEEKNNVQELKVDDAL